MCVGEEEGWAVGEGEGSANSRIKMSLVLLRALNRLTHRPNGLLNGSNNTAVHFCTIPTSSTKLTKISNYLGG